MSRNPQLIEVCDLIVDCEHKTAPTQETGYPSIRTPNIGRGRLILDRVNRVSEDTYREWTRRAEPQPGDLILAREAPVGNVAIIPEGLKVCLGQRTVLIRPNPEEVDGRFLTYLLLGREVQSHIHSLTNGATVHHLNVKDIKQLPLPYFPDLPTQRQIADTLSAYDDLIENNTRRIAILEEMAQRLYREWFVHFRYPGHESVPLVESELGPIPDGWEVSRLGDAIELAYGKALKAEHREEGPYPVYGSSGIVGRHVTPLVTGPGVIVGRKGNVGSVNWSHEDFFPIDTVFYVVTKLPLRFIYYLLKNQTFINNDSAVPGLNRNYAHSKQWIVPPSHLISTFDSWVAGKFNLSQTLESQNAVLTAIRDLLLPRMVSGLNHSGVVNLVLDE